VVKASQQSPRTLALLSGKGGTGKTHIAVNLAVLFARQGHRLLLIDTDLGSANAGIRIGVKPARTLIDFYEGKCELQDCIKQTGLGFDIIASMPGHHAIANMPDDIVVAFLKAFELLIAGSHYHQIIFDLGAGISNRVIDFGIVSDEIIVVAVPNEIVHAYSVLKACWTRFCGVQSHEYIRTRADISKTPYYLGKNYDGECGGPDISYLVNKAESYERGKKIFLRIKKVAEDFFFTKEGYWKLPVRYVGSLPDAYQFLGHSEKQKLPAVVMDPHHPYCLSLNEIARVLMSSYNLPVRKIKAPLASRVKSMIASWHRK